MTFPPIAGDGNAALFALRRDPDGVYRIDGRVIPVRDDGACAEVAVDHRKAIIPIHDRLNDSERLSGSVLGVNVKE